MIVKQIENDNHITDFKVVDSIISDKNLIGNFIKNTAELTILNEDHKYDDLNGQYIDIKNFGSWYVNDLKTDEEMLSSTLSLNDCTQKFDEEYKDTFPFPATLGQWAEWIGKQVGVPLEGTFLNYDLVLPERPYLGSNPIYRDAVKKIAKYASSYAQANFNNTYSIKWLDDQVTEIEDWESFVHGNKTPETNVIVLSTGDTEDNVKYPAQEPKSPHELRIEDEWTNIDRYSINEAIFNQVKGFCYTPISKLEVPYGLLNLRAGEKIKTQDIEYKDVETYISKVILEWQGGAYEDSNSWTTSIQMEELNETSTKLSFANSVKNDILRVERKTDKNTGEIEDVIEKTNDQEKRMSQVLQTVEEIRNEVSNIIDLTIENEANNALLNFENVSSGNPLKIKIHPIGRNISYLYPRDNLFPSDTLYLESRTIRFENTTTKEIFEYELPDDLLLYDELNYDEFELDYETKTCKVTKRIGYKADGSTYVLDRPIVTQYDYPIIVISEGNYKITILGHNSAYIYAKMILQNNYTNLFATKEELRSSIVETDSKIELSVENITSFINDEVRILNARINLTAQEIDFEVSKKMDSSVAESLFQQTAEEISTKVSNNDNGVELASIIRQTSELIYFQSNNFGWTSFNSSMSTSGELTCSNADIKGTINSTNGSIGGWAINEEGLTNGTIFIKSNGYSTIYTASDLFIMRAIITGEPWASVESGTPEFNRYDLNGDGQINASDLLQLRKMIGF